MDFFKNIFSNIYEELWKAVIRPNRDIYKDRDLGHMKFSYCNKWFKRTDFSISNKRDYKLACSFWEPFDEEREYVRLPCVIYLHGNSSSRCEALAEIKYLLPLNITVFAFCRLIDSVPACVNNTIVPVSICSSTFSRCFYHINLFLLLYFDFSIV